MRISLKRKGKKKYTQKILNDILVYVSEITIVTVHRGCLVSIFKQ